MKHEAKFQTKFNHWLKDHLKHIFVYKLPDCGYQTPFDAFSVDHEGKFYAWELKQTNKDYISFSALAPHQLEALKRVKGMVVIKYPDFFCLIDIQDWIRENELSSRRSLTSSRAKEIATWTVLINIPK